jgi:para-nitrobenzyl esterase
MPTPSTTTSTSYGGLQGVRTDGVVALRGIPYAQPPAGPLRFAPPAPVDGWTGLRDATTFGPPAMQAPNAVRSGLTVESPDEDCLTLNVWTPAPDGARRPVLVWLHGGAFVTGSGSSPMCNGAPLARRGDIVVVTINYRLGLFGYLRGIHVCGDALPTSGNEGLLDQIAALRWVQDEIAAFGGDPEQVTVAGQSAGARSIAAMLAMPETRGLFQRAILQSGPALMMPPAAANRVTEAILADVGLAPGEAGRLRDLPADRLLDIQTRVTPRARGIAYGPVADGTIMPEDPLAAIAGGSAAGIPILTGTTLEEWKFFRLMDPEGETLTDDGLLARLADPRTNAVAGDNARFDPAEAVALYREARAARGEDITAREVWFAIMTDRRFRVPGMRLAEAHAAHTPDTYAYLFTWKSPGWGGRLGSGHVVEVPFVFGTLDAPDSQDLVPDGSPVGTLPTRMQDAWIAFARRGTPQTTDIPAWEPYTASRRATMLLGDTSALVDAPYETERRFWASRVGASVPSSPLPSEVQPTHPRSRHEVLPL